MTNTMQIENEHSPSDMQLLQIRKANPLQCDCSPLCRRNAEGRKLLICTGAPLSKQRDGRMAEQVQRYRGKKIICGGTTAQILSREWQRELTVDLDSAGELPPISHIEGIDLVTEGVITLGSLRRILSQKQHTPAEQKGAAWRIYEMIRRAEQIDLLVGTRVNPAHQRASLAGRLENRQHLLTDMAHILKEQHGKTVRTRLL